MSDPIEEQAQEVANRWRAVCNVDMLAAEIATALRAARADGIASGRKAEYPRLHGLMEENARLREENTALLKQAKLGPNPAGEYTAACVRADRAEFENARLRTFAKWWKTSAKWWRHSARSERQAGKYVCDVRDKVLAENARLRRTLEELSQHFDIDDGVWTGRIKLKDLSDGTSWNPMLNELVEENARLDKEGADLLKQVEQECALRVAAERERDDWRRQFEQERDFRVEDANENARLREELEEARRQLQVRRGQVEQLMNEAEQDKADAEAENAQLREELEQVRGELKQKEACLEDMYARELRFIQQVKTAEARGIERAAQVADTWAARFRINYQHTSGCAAEDVANDIRALAAEPAPEGRPCPCGHGADCSLLKKP